jgi:hypothetical protein
VLGALGMLSVAAVALAMSDPAALCALPALALALLMALRPYPGERALVVLRRARPTIRRRPAASRPSGGRPEIVLPRGGQLLARALAVRPPPAAGSAPA